MSEIKKLRAVTKALTVWAKAQSFHRPSVVFAAGDGFMVLGGSLEAHARIDGDFGAPAEPLSVELAALAKFARLADERMKLRVEGFQLIADDGDASFALTCNGAVAADLIPPRVTRDAPAELIDLSAEALRSVEPAASTDNEVKPFLCVAWALPNGDDSRLFFATDGHRCLLRSAAGALGFPVTLPTHAIAAARMVTSGPVRVSQISGGKLALDACNDDADVSLQLVYSSFDPPPFRQLLQGQGGYFHFEAKASKLAEQVRTMAKRAKSAGVSEPGVTFAFREGRAFLEDAAEGIMLSFRPDLQFRAGEEPCETLLKLNCLYFADALAAVAAERPQIMYRVCDCRDSASGKMIRAVLDPVFIGEAPANVEGGGEHAVDAPVICPNGLALVMPVRI